MEKFIELANTCLEDALFFEEILFAKREQISGNCLSLAQGMIKRIRENYNEGHEYVIMNLESLLHTTFYEYDIKDKYLSCASYVKMERIMEGIQENVKHLMEDAQEVDCKKELHETKRKLGQLEEKLEALIQRDRDRSSLIERIQNERLLSFTDHSISRFIHINCSHILIRYCVDINPQEGFVLEFDNEKIPSHLYLRGLPYQAKRTCEDFHSIYKVINVLKNIQTISFIWNHYLFPSNVLSDYFKGHFDIIKKLIINNKVKINLSIHTQFPSELFKYLFINLQIDHIVEFNIEYSFREKPDLLIDIMNKFVKTLEHKDQGIFTFKNIYKPPPPPIDLGY